MNYYNNIKNELINNEINKRVKNYSINRGDLNTYYKVGKILSEAGKHYGEGIIEKYSQKLSSEVDKKYNKTNLKRMRQFYIMIEKSALMGHQLSWSHYRELIPLKDIDKINYYISVCEKNYITRDELKKKIKSKKYERLPSNKKENIINEKEFSIIDCIKNLIVIRNNKTYDILSEKILQKIILEDIELFMKELIDEGFKMTKYDSQEKVFNASIIYYVLKSKNNKKVI